ncbi:hypothetical protein [Labrys wisconsinensis]|uniref:DUF4279 domain-containing protein n=1 Tax=Labrys wisconsinensis TaxID=425677 RepID=A0ABU0JED9_9HYPH|nr:hypothetical protein [Labrys wisconsinensis]MDQ0471644.1 hypothetical protein [Labrys wisconsinensis]
MPHDLPFAAVLRLGDVALLRPALEAELGLALDRYEPARQGPLHHAQASFELETEGWTALAAWLGQVGPPLRRLRERSAVGSAALDLAIAFRQGAVAASALIPATVAEAAGRHGIDLELSVYLTSDEDRRDAP